MNSMSTVCASRSNEKGELVFVDGIKNGEPGPGANLRVVFSLL